MQNSFDGQPQFPGIQSKELKQSPWIWALCGIALLAFALRLHFVLSAVINHPVRGDATQYFAAAWNLVHHHVFSITPPGSPAVSGDSFRDPGFPLLLAGWLWIFGDAGPWYAATIITQAMLSALAIPLLLSALRRSVSDRWLIATGVLMSIWPHSITACSYLLTETLTAFLCATSLFLLSRGINEKRYRWFVASGLCFGAAGLTNAVLIPVALLLAIGVAIFRRVDKKFALVLALCGLSLPIAWQARNLTLPTSDQTSSDRALLNFVEGSWPEYHSSWRAYALGDPAGAKIQQRIMDEYILLRDQPALGKTKMLDRLEQTPGRYLWWYVSKPAHLWAWSIQIGQGNIYIYPTDHSPFDYSPAWKTIAAVCFTLNPIIGLLAAWGCLATFWRRNRSPGIVIAMVILALYVTLVYSLLQAEPRYAIPYRGIELALAMAGLWHLVQWLSSIRHRPSLPCNAEGPI